MKSLRLLGSKSLLLVLAGWCLGCEATETAHADQGTNPTPTASETRPLHPTIVHQPRRLDSLPLGTGDEHRVRCETCHALRADAPMPTAMRELDRFHQGLSLQHGSLSCASCHAAGQPPTLKLASGTVLPMTEALQLCAQCHGPQYRDYQHGTHGGMQGYWDRTRGQRFRNHCVDCHDPHLPAVPQVQPVFAPRDRFFHTETNR